MRRDISTCGININSQICKSAMHHAGRIRIVVEQTPTNIYEYVCIRDVWVHSCKEKKKGQQQQQQQQ